MQPHRSRFSASAAATSEGWHMRCSTSEATSRGFMTHHTHLWVIVPFFLSSFLFRTRTCQEHFLSAFPYRKRRGKNHHHFFLQLPHWCSNLTLLLRCLQVLPWSGRPVESNTKMVSTDKNVTLFSCGGVRGLLASSELLTSSRIIHGSKRKLRSFELVVGQVKYSLPLGGMGKSISRFWW